MDVAVLLFADMVLVAYCASRILPRLPDPYSRFRKGLLRGIFCFAIGAVLALGLLNNAVEGVITTHHLVYIHATRDETPLLFWATWWGLDAICIGLCAFGIATGVRSVVPRTT